MDTITRVLEFGDGEQVLMSGTVTAVNTVLGIVDSVGEFNAALGSAPSVARVAKGLEMLETAEKVEALRQQGVGLITDQYLVTDYLGNEKEFVAKWYIYAVKIDKTRKQVVKPFDAMCKDQHAATLAAIAAYEAKYGEVMA